MHTLHLSGQPSSIPSSLPTSCLSDCPSAVLSLSPSTVPSDQPSRTQPISLQSDIPSMVPSSRPTTVSSDKPSMVPSSRPSIVQLPEKVFLPQDFQFCGSTKEADTDAKLDQLNDVKVSYVYTMELDQGALLGSVSHNIEMMIRSAVIDGMCTSTGTSHESLAVALSPKDVVSGKCC